MINTSTHNVKWPPFAEMMCKRFKYDHISSMVTGAEGADLACKIARRYAHDARKIPADQVLILAVSDSYHGLSSGVWNLQDPSPARTGKLDRRALLCLPADHRSTAYGLDSAQHTNRNPSTGELLRYGQLGDMEACLAEHHARVGAVIMECIRNTGKFVTISAPFYAPTY